MKFKKDGIGWKDLKVEGRDGAKLQICFKVSDKKTAFVSVVEGHNYADAFVTHRKLRAIAKAILAELGE